MTVDAEQVRRTADEYRTSSIYKRARERGARFADQMQSLCDEVTAMSRKRSLSEADQDRFTQIQTETQDLMRRDLRESVLDGSMILEGEGDGLSQHMGGSQRDQARRIIDQAHRLKDLPEAAAAIAEKLVTDGSTFEQSIAQRWAIATGAPAYARAFTKLAADPERGHLLWTPEEADAFRAVAVFTGEQRAMSTTTTAGGFMLPLTLDPTILLTSAGSINPLRRISRVVQTASSSWHGVTSAGATAEWKTEGAQAADASPTLGEIVIPVYLGDAYVPYSFEIGMDGSNFLAELQKVLVDAADQLQATAYTTGAGSTEPKGVITAVAAVGGSVVTPTTPETFVAADVFKVQNALPPRFQANAQWCANLAFANLIRQFETTNGALKFSEMENDRLLRRPFNELSNMDGTFDAAATANNYTLLYGDFSENLICDRIGTTMEFVPIVLGANGRPTGQRGALLWFRTGSDVAVTNAFRLLNIATTA